MKIQLKQHIRVLGRQGDQVNVPDPMGRGLIRRGQAVEVTDTFEGMTVAQLQEEAKKRGISYSGLRKKELKEKLITKEDKEDYQTK